MTRSLGFVVLVVLLTYNASAHTCSLCPSNLSSQTLRQDASQARLVLFGTLTNPRLSTGTDGLAGGGTTDLVIDKVVKPDPFLGNKKTIELPRYVPVSDPKNPPKFLIFCDVFKGKDDNKEKLDPYRGMPVKSPAVVDYLQGALALDAKDRERTLLYFFNYLDHKEVEISNDAFLEIAKVPDQELGQAATKFSAAKLRGWIQDPQTPLSRLSLYGFLLGACGSDKDAALLESLLQNPAERTLSALDGLLVGYIQLRPREGWNMVETLLRDAKKPFTQRFAVLRTLRFFHGWKPEETRRELVRGIGAVVDQGDIADLAVEDLRRWQIWDLTVAVLAQYGKKSHDAPIVRRSIVRYALSCPRPEAARFVADLRKQDPELVKEVEESLQFDKPK